MFVLINCFSRIFRMNLFLDVVRRSERLMSNTYTEDDLNHEIRLSRELIGLSQSSTDTVQDLYNPFNERRSITGKAVVFIFIQL